MSVCKINHLLAQMDNIVHLHLYSRDEPKVLSRFAALVYRYVNNEICFVLQKYALQHMQKAFSYQTAHSPSLIRVWLFVVHLLESSP